MEEVAADLYNAGRQDWMVMVDWLSGYIWTDQLKRTCSRDVTDLLTKWFLKFGWPSTLQSDGGPLFHHKFKEFCSRNGITHELMSPYNPQANGLAEAAVKNVKNFILK